MLFALAPASGRAELTCGTHPSPLALAGPCGIVRLRGLLVHPLAMERRYVIWGGGGDRRGTASLPVAQPLPPTLTLEGCDTVLATCLQLLRGRDREPFVLADVKVRAMPVQVLVMVVGQGDGTQEGYCRPPPEWWALCVHLKAWIVFQRWKFPRFGGLASLFVCRTCCLASDPSANQPLNRPYQPPPSPHANRRCCATCHSACGSWRWTAASSFASGAVPWTWSSAWRAWRMQRCKPTRCGAGNGPPTTQYHFGGCFAVSE